MIEQAGDHIRVRFAYRQGQKPVIQTLPFRSSEIDWLSGEPRRLRGDEQVRPEAILVIFRDGKSFSFQQLQDRPTASMADLAFVHPCGSSPDKNRYILEPKKPTITTVYGAKGYDAPNVFLVGLDAFPRDLEGRAAFYVGATRAKMLLCLTGTSQESSLLQEARSIRALL